ncbi:MAG TPA: hypothetical protein VFA07_18435 [Chthonomonadaceae bacterium]|nr:hypothetical protein [Chthonomonadaceae bacterium]
MEEKQPLSSWQIVDDIVATYKIGRHYRALDKIARALENPDSLTREHRALLRRVGKKLYKRLGGEEKPVQSPPEPVWQPPEPVEPLLAEMHEAERSGDPQAIFAKIDQVLKKSQTLPQASSYRELLQRRRDRLAKVLDPDWQAPFYPDYEEFVVLHERSRMYHAKRDHEAGLSYAWAYAEYCAMGTIAFHRALSHLADSAALFGDMEMARHAVEMYLSHYDLLQRAFTHSATPVGDAEPANEHWSFLIRMLDDTFPFEAALRGIVDDTTHCWARVLELAVFTMHLTFRSEGYQQVLQTLQQHYERTGNSEKIKWLREQAGVKE